MAESHRLHSVGHPEKKITFEETCLRPIDGHSNGVLSEKFAMYFSIDDDDDIIQLDESEVIIDEVNKLLQCLINDVLHQENDQSQIRNMLSKRSLHVTNEDDYLLNKKVRFNTPDEKQQPFPCLFVSETIPSTNEYKPYAQFLYNLGFDLCLEQNLHTDNSLSSVQKQTLIDYNKVFHQSPVYSCKYCSFQTDTIHSLDYHYRTPHTLSNPIYRYDKYRCTYCSFQTFRLPELRRHFERKHGYLLISEASSRRYRCSFCSYETNEKHNILKHNNRCQIEQTRTRNANNLLAPIDQLRRDVDMKFQPMRPKSTQTNKNQSMMNNSPINSGFPSKTKEVFNHKEIIEPILIESDHDSISASRSSSSSDEDFIVSSDEGSSSTTDNEAMNDHSLEKKSLQLTCQPTTSSLSHSHSVPSTGLNTLSSLSKLLLLNATPMPSYTPLSYNSNKPPLIPIQPKHTLENEIHQLCPFCQNYVYRKDYLKHVNEKHNGNVLQSHATSSTPVSNSNNTPTSGLTSNKPTTNPSAIFLLSTSTTDGQSVPLTMIKCPWCDTNFEHIDIMTGHLMRFHRMTLAAAKVVVAEQMKIQSTTSNQLSFMFKLEIEQIQKDFIDKIYWKISQPKVYLHQIDALPCFACHANVDDIKNHLLSLHQIQISTMNTMKQCCLCGFHCDTKNTGLYEHQLRTHSGVCYSSVLKQFIRFEPPPPLLSRAMTSKNSNRQILTSTSLSKRTLTTYTDKKFGCRKCDTSNRLFTFDELVEHLRSIHYVNVKLHRRCMLCQETFLKGNEYNQHCLEHFQTARPSIEIKRYHKRK